MRSSDGGGGATATVSKQQASLYATEILSQIHTIKQAATILHLNGCPKEHINSYAPGGDAETYGHADLKVSYVATGIPEEVLDSGTCSLFHAKGGGLDEMYIPEKLQIHLTESTINSMYLIAGGAFQAAINNEDVCKEINRRIRGTETLDTSEIDGITDPTNFPKQPSCYMPDDLIYAGIIFAL